MHVPENVRLAVRAESVESITTWEVDDEADRDDRRDDEADEWGW